MHEVAVWCCLCFFAMIDLSFSRFPTRCSSTACLVLLPAILRQAVPHTGVTADPGRPRYNSWWTGENEPPLTWTEEADVRFLTRSAAGAKPLKGVAACVFVATHVCLWPPLHLSPHTYTSFYNSCWRGRTSRLD